MNFTSKILALCKVSLIIQLYLFSNPLNSPADKYSLKYDFKEGDVLTYSQVFEGEYQLDPEREEKYILQMEWVVKIGVIRCEEGLYHLAVQYNRKKLDFLNRDALEQSIGKEEVEEIGNYFKQFEKHFVQYVVMNEKGKNINGTFYLNEMPSLVHSIVSQIFHLPEIPLMINDHYYREDEQRLKITFTGIENTMMGECFVLKTEAPGLGGKLLLNRKLGVPDMMMYSSQYQFRQRKRSVKFVLLFQKKKNLKWEEMLKDDELNKALLLSSLGKKTPYCHRDIIEDFLQSDDNTKQNLAITYCSLRGIPEGLDLNDYLRSPNPTVRFNAAKALFRFKNTRSPLDVLISDEDFTVRLRAKQFFSQSSYFIPEKKYELFKSVQDFIYSDGKTEQEISESVNEVKDVLKYIKPENDWIGGCYRFLITSEESLIQRPYYIYLPEDYDPAELYPVIIFLGGGEGRGDTAFKSIYQDLKVNNDLSNYILFVPQAQGYWWEEEVDQVFNQLLFRIYKAYSIDTNQIYLVGTSNGGMGSFFYSTHRPDKFAAMASLMGFPVVKHRPPQSKEDAIVLKNLRNTAVCLIHGEKDDKVGPGGVRMANQMLSQLNFKIKYKELPGRGHDIGFGEFEPELVNWFQSHQRNPRPPEVEFVMNYPNYNRSYWIQVNKTKKLPAEVFAEIKGNTVEIKTKGVLHLTVFLDEELVNFSKEVVIKINKKPVYRGKLSPSAESLLKLARENRDAQLSYSVALDFALDSSS